MPVVEGVELHDLARGVGHYPETARPGQVGNFAVAGHRATNGEPFADLDQLRKGDVVVVETRSRLVHLRRGPDPDRAADDTWVLDPVPGKPDATPTQQLLTLTTCNPRWASYRAADRLRPPAGEPVGQGGRAAGALLRRRGA